MKHNTYNYEGGQPFKVEAPFTPTGDQPTAIQSLTEGVERGEWAQVLLGATGTGKTFTMAKVIEAVQKPTLIIAHNKTLAAQLCSEFKSFSLIMQSNTLYLTMISINPRRISLLVIRTSKRMLPLMMKLISYAIVLL